MRSSVTLEEVSDLYMKAASESRSPLARLAEQLGVSQSTATRRVRDARNAGLIPPDVRTTNPYLPAIAKDLGVTVDELEVAIRKHAPNGNLRVIVSGR